MGLAGGTGLTEQRRGSRLAVDHIVPAAAGHMELLADRAGNHRAGAYHIAVGIQTDRHRTAAAGAGIRAVGNHPAHSRPAEGGTGCVIEEGIAGRTVADHIAAAGRRTAVAVHRTGCTDRKGLT